MYKVEVSAIARDQIFDIFLYISKRLGNPTGAKRIVDEIYHKIASLCLFPEGYANLEGTNYRRIHHRRYSIIYVVNREQKIVTVARVYYSRQNFLRLLS